MSSRANMKKKICDHSFWGRKVKKQYLRKKGKPQIGPDGKTRQAYSIWIVCADCNAKYCGGTLNVLIRSSKERKEGSTTASPCEPARQLACQMA